MIYLFIKSNHKINYHSIVLKLIQVILCYILRKFILTRLLGLIQRAKENHWLSVFTVVDKVWNILFLFYFIGFIPITFQRIGRFETILHIKTIKGTLLWLQINDVVWWMNQQSNFCFCVLVVRKGFLTLKLSVNLHLVP